MGHAAGRQCPAVRPCGATYPHSLRLPASVPDRGHEGPGPSSPLETTLKCYPDVVAPHRVGYTLSGDSPVAPPPRSDPQFSPQVLTCPRHDVGSASWETHPLTNNRMSPKFLPCPQPLTLYGCSTTSHLYPSKVLASPCPRSLCSCLPHPSLWPSSLLNLASDQGYVPMSSPTRPLSAPPRILEWG